MPSKIVLSEEQLTQIREDFKKDISIKTIANKNNMSVMSLRPVLKSMGLKRLGRITDNTVEEVLKYKDRHISFIHKETGLDPVTIKKIFKSQGITPSRRPAATIKTKKLTRYEEFKITFTEDHIQSLLDRSLYYAVIQTGFSETIIKRYINEFGLEYRKKFRTIRDLSDSDIEDIRVKYCSGDYTKHEICKLHEIGSRTIRQVLNGYSKPEVFKDGSFEQYKKIVRRITTVVKNLYNIHAPAGYHVDHKISVYDGFIQGIPPYLIASKENLEIIPSLDNLKKGSSSSFSKDELYRLLEINYSSSP